MYFLFIFVGRRGFFFYYYICVFKEIGDVIVFSSSINNRVNIR